MGLRGIPITCQCGYAKPNQRWMLQSSCTAQLGGGCTTNTRAGRQRLDRRIEANLRDALHLSGQHVNRIVAVAPPAGGFQGRTIGKTILYHPFLPTGGFGIADMTGVIDG
jgi:hypothetical protein